MNDFDIVTRVPPEEFAFPLRFTHVDALRWIDRHGAVDNGPVPTAFFKDVIGAANATFMLHIVEHPTSFRRFPIASGITRRSTM